MPDVVALPSTVRPVVERIARIAAVERVILFGSRATGAAGPRADVDLAVDAPAASADDWRDIREAVRSTRTLYAIDLVRLDAASEALRAEVRRDGILLYERR